MTRAVRAVAKAGASVARVEIDAAGKVVVVIGKPTDGAEQRNEWDEALDGKHQA